MSIILVTSSTPRAGRSLVAAALAYRLGRAGHAVTLVRLAGDDSAEADARAFAALEGVVSPGVPYTVEQLKSVPGEVIGEAPVGPAQEVAAGLGARIIAVQADIDAPADAPRIGSVVMRARASDIARLAGSEGVIAVLPEDDALAAPSVSDIATAIHARWLTGDDAGAAIDTVMIGTVSSDSASPYFANRRRTCVITRFDKTDIQLAALQTDVECLVMTGGGEPSPFLIDRVRGSREHVAVLLAPDSTVATMRAIEPLFGQSRFSGQAKLERAVDLLDAADAPVTFD
ncbi:MAG: hypothetical protein HYX50_02225 [Chloroflexi bacterium]|nr:hypothetical protein [Chloroflexota bacterium]